ncbi:MAG: acyltransferase [Lachnospiraceae bacterium]|nr:acyltransferase [Lachnospiraceae bacterium]
MQESKNRYINVYVGVGIGILVLGYSKILPETFKIWVEAFVLLLFFTAAGVYGRESGISELGMTDLIKKGAREIMIPYCWMSLLVVTGRCAGMLLFPMRFTKEDTIAMTWDMLSFYGGSVLWFLPVFFVGVTVYWTIRKKLFYPVALILTAVLAAVICGINGIPVYLYGKEMSVEVFLLQCIYTVWRGCVGMFFCAVGEGLSMLLGYLERKKLMMILLGFALTGIGTLLALKNQEKADVTLSFRYLLTGEMVFWFLAAIFLCGGLLFLCRWINECRPLEYLGRSSLIVLATCLDFKVTALAGLAGDKVFAIFDHDFLRNVVMLVVLIVVELFLIWLFHGILSFMYGKKQKNN